MTLNLAISILIMRSVFQLVPHELMEAAKMDGAGPWKTLWLVGLPMVRNGLVVIFIVNFVAALGDFAEAAFGAVRGRDFRGAG